MSEKGAEVEENLLRVLQNIPRRSKVQRTFLSWS